MQNSTTNDNSLFGYLAFPENKKGKAVLVLHAWWGLNNFIKQFADRLAKEGYVVFAPDLYNGSIATSISEAETLINQMDEDHTQKVLGEQVRTLLKNPNCASSKLTIIGFSMGAGFASWLANNKPDEIEKVVQFYGTGETDFSNTKASFLCHFAENDPYEEEEYVNLYKKSLQMANISAKHYHYRGTYHWFFESDQIDYYNEESSKLAWERTLKFLHQ